MPIKPHKQLAIAYIKMATTGKSAKIDPALTKAHMRAAYLYLGNMALKAFAASPYQKQIQLAMKLLADDARKWHVDLRYPPVNANVIVNLSRFRLAQAALPTTTSIRLREIPEKYLASPGNAILPWNKRFGRLGRGATSIVINDPNDPDKVLVFTRDDQKKDWLVFGQHGLAVKWLENFDSNGNGKDFADFPIYVISMPKLKPLSNAQAAMIHEQVDELTRLLSMNHGHSREHDAYQLFMDAHPNSPITPVLTHLENYDPSQFLIDMHKLNFMQDDKGDIYATDPVVSRELLKTIRNRYNRRIGFAPGYPG